MYFSSNRKQVCIVSLFLLTVFSGFSFSQDTTIAKRIPVPAGFVRQEFPAGSFSTFVQSLSLKKTNQIVMFDGHSLEQAQIHNLILESSYLLISSNFFNDRSVENTFLRLNERRFQSPPVN